MVALRRMALYLHRYCQSPRALVARDHEGVYTVSEAVKYIGEFMLGLLTLSMITVLVLHSGGTSSVISASATGGSTLLNTAMGNGSSGMFGNFGGAMQLSNPGFNISGFGG